MKKQTELKIKSLNNKAITSKSNTIVQSVLISIFNSIAISLLSYAVVKWNAIFNSTHDISLGLPIDIYKVFTKYIFYNTIFILIGFILVILLLSFVMCLYQRVKKIKVDFSICLGEQVLEYCRKKLIFKSKDFCVLVKSCSFAFMCYATYKNISADWLFNDELWLVFWIISIYIFVGSVVLSGIKSQKFFSAIDLIVNRTDFYYSSRLRHKYKREVKLDIILFLITFFSIFVLCGVLIYKFERAIQEVSLLYILAYCVGFGTILFLAMLHQNKLSLTIAIVVASYLFMLVFNSSCVIKIYNLQVINRIKDISLSIIVTEPCFYAYIKPAVIKYNWVKYKKIGSGEYVVSGYNAMSVYSANGFSLAKLTDSDDISGVIDMPNCGEVRKSQFSYDDYK